MSSKRSRFSASTSRVATSAAEATSPPLGLALLEWPYRTETSGWFGHQSWFVLGRCGLGVGAGIPGFSLSLTLSVAAFVVSDTWAHLLFGAVRCAVRHGCPLLSSLVRVRGPACPLRTPRTGPSR